MKFIKKLFLGLIALLLIGAIGLYITGNYHLLSGIPKTYLKGKTGPDIDDYGDFHNLEIKAGAVDEWPMSDSYNSGQISAEGLALHKENSSVAYLVIKNGEIVFEKYWEDYDENSKSNSFSVAKSIVAMTIGIAIEEGKISSIKQKASDFIEEFKGGPNEGVTIEQLLQMKSNIAFDESYGNPFGFMAKAYYGDDLIEKTLAFEVEGTPGTKWQYLGGNTLLLAIILERATGESIHQYVEDKLWKPMGAKNTALWSTDEEGGFEKAYCCFYTDARDFSRFGELVLHKGNWKGNQLIPSKWLEETVTPVVLDDPTHTLIDHYGYQMWLGEYKGLKFSMFRGILGQYIITIPEKSMVVTRLGHKRSKAIKNNLPVDVYVYIEDALNICKEQ